MRPSGLTRHTLIVDALLGTGLKREVKGPLCGVIKKINTASSSVISVDIPSGISSDTGHVMGCAVKAHYTVTFGLPKRGHLLFQGIEHTGGLYVEEIGFPAPLLRSERIKVSLLEETDMFRMVPERPRYSNKRTFGHVLLVAGSRGKTGAALMAARACLRAGAGLVTIGVPESTVSSLQSRVTEEMILPLSDRGDGTVSYKASEAILDFIKQRANVLAIGPGISTGDEISELLKTLILRSRVPVVIDADGLNAISGRTGILRKSRSPVILTPHAGEMARLISDKGGKINSQHIEKDRINISVSFAKKTKSYLVLKGVPTVIAVPDGKLFINSTGNSGMATAGTGDVLTGIISAFLAQGMTPQESSILGVYMHGYIGDIMAEKKGKHSLIASDIIKAIPSVFKKIGPK
jgi:NAD(P)H-hydrate epimerase